jgi:Ran GTPase-activating protein (RanGAP) involved in mRNA processing and transport
LASIFAAALVAARSRSLIRTLKLDHNAIGDAGLIILARSTGLHQLTQLQLAANGVSDRGALALAQSDLFPRLAHLDLRQNQLTHEAIDALWSNHRRRVGSILLLGDNIPPPPPESNLANEDAIPIPSEPA